MKVIVICGATATGKSELAVKLAKKLNSEIINFDSVQVFKEFDIGSAKPTPAQLKMVKHHLIGEVPPNEEFTAGDFRKKALEILNGLDSNFVILVGGTGFYLQALLKGMFDAPPSDENVKHKLRLRLDADGLDKLYDELAQKDPSACGKIHKNDEYRILRALEVIEVRGESLTEIKAKFTPQKFPYPIIKIGLRREKEKLRTAVWARTEKMLEAGLIEEVQGLIQKWGVEAKPLSTVGYKEAVDFINGKIKNREELQELISIHTMQLVKRQSTWFKRDTEIHWFDPDKENIFENALGLVTSLDKNQ